MNKLTIISVIGSCAAVFAQSVTIQSASPLYPGAVMAASVVLSGSAGKNLAGIGFTLPTGSGSPAVGAADDAAGKVLLSNGLTVLILSPLAAPNQNPIADGVLANFNYTLPTSQPIGSSIQLSLPIVLGADIAGSGVSISADPFNGTVGISPACTATIQSATTAFLSGPTQTLLGQILSDIGAAIVGGQCK